jgi:phosphoenolpyruvate-protein kinase (PTS system EI component)
MFVSAALVVDIGGALSHAAVAARELGIPCVVNTKHGSSFLRTGDVVRVDGGAGHCRDPQASTSILKFAARPGAVNVLGHARRPPVRRFGPVWTHR